MASLHVRTAPCAEYVVSVCDVTKDSDDENWKPLKRKRGPEDLLVYINTEAVGHLPQTPSKDPLDLPKALPNKRNFFYLILMVLSLHGVLYKVGLVG